MTGTAPCGHPGEYVIGQFVLCLTCGRKPRCSRCGSDNAAPFLMQHMPPDAMHCLPCGSVFWPGVH